MSDRDQNGIPEADVIYIHGVRVLIDRTIERPSEAEIADEEFQLETASVKIEGQTAREHMESVGQNPDDKTIVIPGFVLDDLEKMGMSLETFITTVIGIPPEN